MDYEALQVLPLHKHTEFTKECCNLINDEWPRSETARLMSLQASCDDLPTSLVLINDQKLVLGHCKLTPIPSIPESCFVETVVISKAFRGMKLGTYLMKKAEEYCREILGLQMIHLSTKGQENFYAKLGYNVCPPVSIFGTRIPNYKPAQVKETEPITNKNKSINESSSPTLGVGVPPPPPPMPNTQTNAKPIKSSKTFMMKYLN